MEKDVYIALVSVASGENSGPQCSYSVSIRGEVAYIVEKIMTAHSITGLVGYQLFLAIVTIPERYQIVNVNSALTAGIRLMPLLFASATGSTINGLVSSRKNLVSYSLVAACCILLLGSGLLSTIPFSETVDPALYGYQVIFGLGIGGTLSSTVIIACLYSNYEDYGECHFSS